MEKIKEIIKKIKEKTKYCIAAVICINLFSKFEDLGLEPKKKKGKIEEKLWNWAININTSKENLKEDIKEEKKEEGVYISYTREA